jgi:hypothetical protein
MKTEVCSPLKEKTYTCYTSESLDKLKNLWNARHPDSPIKAKHDKDIWNALKKNMGNVCDSESCWLRQGFSKHGLTNEMKYYTFAPQAPSEWKENPNEWLSSVDIENVMKQYEEMDKTFAFFGPTPIDFDSRKLYGECVWEDLCHFNLLEQMKRNKKKIGIIFNLDEHWKKGSHWVSLFVDVPTEQICYFDSTGEDIPKEIMTLVERITHQGKEVDIHFKFDKNYPFEHQMLDTECGVYSLYFIITMIKNPSFTTFKSKRITDKQMEKYRHIYFRI